MLANRKGHLFILIILIITILRLSVICQAEDIALEENSSPTAGKISKGGELIEQSVRIFTKQDNNKEFKIPLGEKFKVELSESPTTGYTWVIAKSTSPNIGLMKKEFLLPQGDRQVIGGRGIRVFIFEASQPGSAVLDLVLKRPWKDPNKYVDRFSIKLLVQQAVKTLEIHEN